MNWVISWPGDTEVWQETGKATMLLTAYWIERSCPQISALSPEPSTLLEMFCGESTYQVYGSSRQRGP